MADRNAIQTSETELPIEVFPWRQQERHTDSDMGQLDSMVAHAGHKEKRQEEVESVEYDDSSKNSAQLVCRIVRIP